MPIEFRDWEGRHQHPASMHLHLYRSGEDGKQPCAMLTGWRAGNIEPGNAQRGDVAARFDPLPIQQIDREEALAWAAEQAAQRGYELVLVQDELDKAGDDRP